MRTTLEGAITYYESNSPRGEYVLVVEGCTEKDEGDAFWSKMSLEGHVNYYVEQGLKKMDAIKACAKDRGLPKNEVYKIINT